MRILTKCRSHIKSPIFNEQSFKQYSPKKAGKSIKLKSLKRNWKFPMPFITFSFCFLVLISASGWLFSFRRFFGIVRIHRNAVWKCLCGIILFNSLCGISILFKIEMLCGNACVELYFVWNYPFLADQPFY